MMEFKLLLVAGLTVLGGFILFFSGRFRESCGTLRPDRSVTEAFENGRLNPDLVYYISGSDVYPRAVIGIDRRLVLVSDLWEKRDFDPETFRETVRNMQRRALSTLQTLHGFEILDPRDRRIGTWFSVLDVRTTVKMLKDDQVRIDTPPLSGLSEGP